MVDNVVRRSAPLFALATALVLGSQSAEAQTVTTGFSASTRRVAVREPLPETLDFEARAVGEILDEVYGNLGAGPIVVRATRAGADAAAVVFDSANPTGGDPDLGTPHQDFGGVGVGAGGSSSGAYPNQRRLGRVLVVAESTTDADGDGHVDDPGDDERSTTLHFDFAAVESVRAQGITVLDIENTDSSVVLYDRFGIVLDTIPLPRTGDNGLAFVSLGDRSGVQRIDVLLSGSGALDELVFQPDCQGQIGSRVWYDLDGNGVQDATDPGLPRVTVELRDAFGDLAATLESSPTGNYRFEGLCAGTWVVSIDPKTLPGLLDPTLCDVADDSVDADCSPAVVVLASPSTTDGSVDFGFAGECSSGIGDFVWHDLDGDGLQTPGEPGLEGVTVQLFVPGEGSPIATTTTGPNGTYAFVGLCADTYEVVVDGASLPVGFSATTCGAGDDTIDSECSPATVVVPDNGVFGRGTDFGYISVFSGSIGDFVWADLDCDGFQDVAARSLALGPFSDEEVGLGGVRMLLRDDMNVILRETTTRSNDLFGPVFTGAYAFTGLDQGTYVVEVDLSTLPAGFSPSPCDPGLDDTVDNDCSGVTVVLGVGTEGAAGTAIFDFGFRTEVCDAEACMGPYWEANPTTWPAPYTPDTLWGDVFFDFFPGRTLFEVLSQGGFGLGLLGQQSVTALLNAADPNVDYSLTTGEVIGLVDELDLFDIFRVLDLRSYLQSLNDQVCPFENP